MTEQAMERPAAPAKPTATDVPTASTDVMEVRSLPIEKIRAAPWNARRYFDEDSLDDLGKSLQELGQLSPVIVRSVGDKYELIAGERRYRAAKRIGMTHLQAVISDNEDRTVLRKSLAENLDREDLNPWDHMHGVLAYIGMELERISPRWPDLVEDAGDEIRAAAKVVTLSARWYPRAAPAALEELGLLEAEPLLEVLRSVFDRKSQEMTIQSFRVRRLRLLTLPEDLIHSLQRGEMDLTRVLSLDRIKDEAKRKQLMEEALEQGWTSDELSKAVIAALKGATKDAKPAAPTVRERLSAIRTALAKFDQLSKTEQRQVERAVAQLEKLLGTPTEAPAEAGPNTTVNA